MKKSKLVLPLILAAGMTVGCKHHSKQATNAGNSKLTQPNPTPTILGYVNSIPITQYYIDSNISSQVQDLREQAVDLAINQYVLQKEATKQGLTLQQYLKSLSNDQLMDKIDILRKQYNARVLLEPEKYNLPALTSNPTLGPKDAPVKIVEFADFQCPYCKQAEPVLDQVRKVYGNKVSITYMYFPLPFHQYAMNAAKHAICADKQGKFWEMYDYMYTHQDKLTEADLEAEAGKTLNLNIVSYDKCLSDPVTANIIQNNKDVATSLGVSGTPTFFINGAKLSGSQPMWKFTEVIDQELAKK